MPEPELSLLFIQPLNRLGARYIVSGSVAAILYGKLEYFRDGGSEKHLRDIRSMWSVSGDQIDRRALDEWIARQGVEAQWRQAVGS